MPLTSDLGWWWWWSFFPSSSQLMVKLILSPLEKRWKVSPSKASLLLSTREILFAMSSLTTQRRRRHPPSGPPCTSQWTHKGSFKKSLVPLAPDHSPATTHSARWGGKWTRDRELTAVPLTTAPATTNQRLGCGYTFPPGKPPPLPSAKCPTRLTVHTKELRKSWLGVNSQLRRQMSINIYDGKFHYLKILL